MLPSAMKERLAGVQPEIRPAPGSPLSGIAQTPREAGAVMQPSGHLLPKGVELKQQPEMVLRSRALLPTRSKIHLTVGSS